MKNRYPPELARELADELSAAMGNHTRSFADNGYCAAVARANDRIGIVHQRYAEAAGFLWRDGNERLLADLRRRS